MSIAGDNVCVGEGGRGREKLNVIKCYIAGQNFIGIKLVLKTVKDALLQQTVQMFLSLSFAVEMARMVHFEI